MRRLVMKHTWKYFAVLMMFLVAAAVFRPTAAQAKGNSHAIGTEWKRSGGYCFRLTKKGVLSYKDREGRKHEIDRDVHWAYCSGPRAIYLRCSEKEFDDLQNLFTYRVFDASSSERKEFKIEPLVGPLSPVFY